MNTDLVIILLVIQTLACVLTMFAAMGRYLSNEPPKTVIEHTRQLGLILIVAGSFYAIWNTTGEVPKEVSWGTFSIHLGLCFYTSRWIWDVYVVWKVSRSRKSHGNKR